MKKLLSIFACAAVCGAAILGAVACTSEPDAPAPGAACFDLAGNLQDLYGTNGYPQAVLVVKNSVLENDPAAVAAMTSYMEGADNYLATAEPTAVVTALSGCYAEGLTPSLNAKNLTKEVIKNCSVKFTAAQDAKETVNAFLAKLIAIDETFTSAAADAFYYAGGAQAGTVSGQYQVYAPDGAPALALAYAVSETEGNAFTYHVVAANTITAQVTGETPKADFCVLPVNAAAKLLGKGTSYKMLGVVTNGNMYFIRSHNDLGNVTKAGLTELKGKSIGVVQLNNVPGLTLQAVLKDAGVAYQIIDSNTPLAADKVNLIAFADAATVGPAAGCDYYLCPEPAATTKVTAYKNQTAK